MRVWRSAVALVAVTVMCGGCAFITRASVKQDGSPVSGSSGVAGVDISGDGRYVAFTSPDDSIVPGDANHRIDVFVRDLVTGTTERVTSAANSATGGGDTPSMSDDGRYVLFNSLGSAWPELGVPANQWVVLRRDRQGGALEVANRRSDGSFMDYSAASWGPADMSGDGRYVAFASLSTIDGVSDNEADVFVRDITAGTTTQVTPNSADDHSEIPRISADGSTVAFISDASNLVAGDTNGVGDVFLVARTGGTVSRVSVATGGAEGNQASGGNNLDNVSVNADGRLVAFQSKATNLVADDTNGTTDVFVHDRVTGTTTRANLTNGGAQAGTGQYPAISGDGRYVVFSSMTAVAGCEVAVRDRTDGTTACVSTDLTLHPRAGVGTDYKAVSRDGRYVVFSSAAGGYVDNNPAGGPRQLFVRSIPVPTIADASPSSIARGATTTITVHGTGFLAGVSAFLGNSVTLSSVNRISEHEVQLGVTVGAGAQTGSRTAIVFNPGTGPSVAAGAAASFTLTIT